MAPGKKTSGTSPSLGKKAYSLPFLPGRTTRRSQNGKKKGNCFAGEVHRKTGEEKCCVKEKSRERGRAKEGNCPCDQGKMVPSPRHQEDVCRSGHVQEESEVSSLFQKRMNKP